MKPGCYPVDFTRATGEDFSAYRFDASGVPLVRSVETGDWSANPVTVCQYGLHQYNRFVRQNDDVARETFLKQAKWLVDHAEPGPNGSKVWPNTSPLKFYDISAPWISGMAQGEALSVLLRAHALSGDSRYHNTAQAAWKALILPTEDGGVVSRFPDGSPLIEEYPKAGSVTGVLNGFMFALLGVLEYASVTGDEEAVAWSHSLVSGLRHNLHRYDTGFWSVYDLFLPRRLASFSYHRLHIAQLEALFRLTGETVFQAVAEQWRVYLASPLCRLRWTLHKVHQKLVLQI